MPHRSMLLVAVGLAFGTVTATARDQDRVERQYGRQPDGSPYTVERRGGEVRVQDRHGNTERRFNQNSAGEWIERDRYGGRPLPPVDEGVPQTRRNPPGIDRR